jgi:urea transport system permease protein
MKKLFPILLVCWLAVHPAHAAETPPPPRELLVQAILSENSQEQIALVKKLIGANDELISRALTAWRVSELFVHASLDGAKTPFVLDLQLDSDGKAKGINVSNGAFLVGTNGAPLLFLASDLTAVDNNSRLRIAIKTVLDLQAVGNPNPKMRRDAVIKLGQAQNPEYLPHFEARLKIEQNREVIKSLHEAIALTRTVSDDAAIRDAAIEQLGKARSINALSFLKDLQKDANAQRSKYGTNTPVLLSSAIYKIERHISWGNLVGTAFRGLSLSSVLLVAALGLAITFGLMGVINMAHGEVMAVGAYTAYFVQGIFGTGLLFSFFGQSVSVKGFGLTGGGLDSYFIVALAVSFVTAAIVGLILERCVIRFLYKRPLESLLATWGVSLVLQQVFRHTFGAANVQVNSPRWLSGSFVVNDILFAYNRIFVIGFAVFIVFGTYLLLTRTSLGLQIRAVMQNRAMASCVGVRTDRVNMMTFAFGSGLAGMAGACMSQIANVGPSLGQSYIVDCFMIVVLGGVGNLVGTVSASLGVGVTDQILQPWLGAVLGKITVLAAIILFLQWRPAGIFVTRSRSLDS